MMRLHRSLMVAMALAVMLGRPVVGEEVPSAGEGVQDIPAVTRRVWENLDVILTVLRETVLVAGNFEGPVSATNVNYRFLKVTDVTAEVVKDEAGWTIKDIEGTLAEGRMKGTVCIGRCEGGLQTDVDLVFDEVDLKQVMEMAEMSPYTGKVKGRLQLSVRGNAEEGLSGNGSFEVHDANLGNVPVIVKIVGVLGSPSIGRTNFDKARVHFTLTPKRVVFQTIRVLSSDESIVLSAKRNGSITYEGELDFVVEPVIQAKILSGLKLAEELATKVLKAIEGGIAKLRVEGTVDNPRVVWSPHR